MSEKTIKDLPAVDMDAYISQFPQDVKAILTNIRTLISEEVPEAQEKISYGMPTFYLKGNLIHFAAFKKHIGLYPTPTGISNFQEELSKYKQGKGSVQFPLDQPMPYDLIRRIVRYRVDEVTSRSKKS